jgi:hypothetical protein
LNTVLHPCYFGTVAQFVILAQSDNATFEVCDNYQKQTYRNRQHIYAANGKLQLNIPVKHTQDNSGRQAYCDVFIANDFNWQIQHWRSIRTAYKTSPFFEYYEDELYPLYQDKQERLLDFNFKCLTTITACLELEVSIEKTTAYEKTLAHKKDYRFLVNAKAKEQFKMTAYTQVFEEKHGHLTNLSILDLLFNEGPNAINYLESQSIDF